MDQSFRSKSGLYWLIIIVIIIFIVIILIIYLTSTIVLSLIFQPQRELIWRPEDSHYHPHSLFIPLSLIKPAQVEYSAFSTSAHKRKQFQPPANSLHAWYFTDFSHSCNNQKDQTTILFFHGNSGNISQCQWLVDLCAKYKFNLLLVDYPGYGRSPGPITIDNLYQSGRAAYEYLATRIGCDNIIIWGFSLGGTVAIDVAANNNCKGLILHSTFADLVSAVNWSNWGLNLLENWLFPQLNNKLKLAQVDCPVLILHSRDDQIIPYHCAKILYRSCGHQSKNLIKLTGQHNQIDLSEQQIKQMIGFFS